MVADHAMVFFDDESESGGTRFDQVAEGVDKVAVDWLRDEIVGH